MTIQSADKFFDDVDFTSIISTVKGIMTSDGSMSTILDFERVLDEADLYAYQNWIKGELVDGPVTGRYTVKCTFMWPYKLMPDPSGMKRLANIGCNIKMAKSKLKVPIHVKSSDDFIPGSHFPKMVEKQVWYVQIEIPKDLMNEIKEGTIDLADQTIDLDDIDQAYEDDLDKENTQQEDAGQDDMNSGAMGGGMGMPPPPPSPTV
jgi:hypothetical protein